MEFSGEFTVDGTPEELWKYFTDPEILKDCAPGCNKMELESPSHIVAGLAVGVGSVKPSFNVDAIVTVCDRPNRLEINASGEASRNSFQATASQQLHDNGDGTTTVEWTAEAEISGIIASMGERAIGSVTKSLVDEFFKDLEAHVAAGTPAESKLEAASSEELKAAEELAAETAAPADNNPIGQAIGKAAAIAGDGGPSSGQSFAAGILLGLLGSSLVRKLRSGGPGGAPADAALPEESDARPQSGDRSDGGSSLLVLGLTAALGAAGAIIWNQSQSANRPESMTPSTKEPTSTDQNAAGASDENDQIGASDAESDNPLDRLESRP
jgi:hypothetical protein